jgi:hypothetical protein
MKKKFLSLTAISAASLAIAPTAFAHDGDHSMSVFAAIGHWLSSPTHALFSVIAGAAVLALAVKLTKKRA